MQTKLIDQFRDHLRANHSRTTQPKLAVFQYLLSADQPVSISQVALAVPTAHRTTIYRILDNFVTLGIAKLTPRGFKTLYELGELFQRHHHHITCERCGRTISIHSRFLEKFITTISRRAGMLPTHHYIELYGICRKCNQSSRPGTT